MIPSLLQIVTKGVLVATLTLPGLLGLVGGDDIRDLRDRYETVSQQRSELLDRMKTLRGEYQRLVDKIDRRKASDSGDNSTRQSVQQLLSQSQQTARQLEQLQTRLHELDARLRSMRSELVATIDSSVATIEGKLREADAESRQKWVDQLNELRELRREYRIPLPKAPDLAEIKATLRMAERVESGRPDQIQAAADELEDTEDQLRSRLNAVEQKLAQLEQTRTLARRSESFQSEEQFFDEASRPRSVGHHSSSETGGEGTSGDEERLGTGDDPTFEEGDSFRPPPANQGPDNGAGRGDESSDLVLENEADPGEVAGDEYSDRSGLEQRIEQLRRERRQLERRAEQLRERAESLRDRAEQLKSFEQ